MNEMNRKKLYIWCLAAFLADQDMTMSGDELAEHLNRNDFLTGYGTQYEGKRGIYTLIRETWKWVKEDLALDAEADKVARAFVKPDGSYAYQ